MESRTHWWTRMYTVALRRCIGRYVKARRGARRRMSGAFTSRCAKKHLLPGVSQDTPKSGSMCDAYLQDRDANTRSVCKSLQGHRWETQNQCAIERNEQAVVVGIG